MVSSPAWHSGFYLRTLGDAAVSGDECRILISGAADYSMLAYAAHAFRRASKMPEITVLDLCETPLSLCQWYAEYIGLSISTVVSDILEYKPSAKFDLIVADAFLTRFSTDDHSRVLEKWAQLLRQGGRVVTTARIEAGLSGGAVRATSAEASDFGRKALQRARMINVPLGLSPKEMETEACKYAEKMISYPILSEEQLVQLVSCAGFCLEELSLVTARGEIKGTTYAEFVALLS
jgi:SAM-dependent methyltransferase